MRVLVVVLSLTICAAGCAHKAPQSPQPVPPATPEASAPPKTVPVKPATTPTSQAEDKDKSAPQAAKPVPSATAPTEPAESPPPAKAVASAPTAKPPASSTTAKPAPSPAKPAASTATAKPAPPAATKPAASAPTATAKPPVAAKPAAPASSPTLDLAELKDQLKSTKAIGLMTKLTLKNQVDDLLDGFRDHYAGKGKTSISQLRQSYDMLMMKVLSLLQDKDQKLASDIVASREVIWALLADPKKFAALDV